jgi:hypothetical protein
LSGGSATLSYQFSAPGTYKVYAVYVPDASGDFTASNSSGALLTETVNQPLPATVTAASIQWGTSGTAALLTNADGLRLLPATRNTDLPWLNISKITLTLSAAATLGPGNVTVTGKNVATYGPVTVSGSGTSYTLTLAQPISRADRVTVTIGNTNIATYTRRLDVLPGDINDDGAVNASDLVLYHNAISAPYSLFADINGDGAVNITDYNAAHGLVGTALP